MADESRTAHDLMEMAIMLPKGAAQRPPLIEGAKRIVNLEAHVINMETRCEDLAARLVKMDHELVETRHRNHDLKTAAEQALLELGSLKEWYFGRLNDDTAAAVVTEIEAAQERLRAALDPAPAPKEAKP